jgi:cellulose synthase/poly-beta-1,6-N-acetylglucosamine synthase-like glycosyltransferase
MSYPYLHVAFHYDLAGERDRRIYRLLEILPGALSWGTLILLVLISWQKPVWAAIFIIAFDLFWLIKSTYLSMHLRANWKRLRKNIKTDWEKRLENFKYDHIYHMLILPFYKESFEVISDCLESLMSVKYPKDRMIIVLASEERAGKEAEEICRLSFEKYRDKFAYFLTTKHPKDIAGEIPGKGSNDSWAAEEARVKILDANNIKYEDVIVSAFDIDTRVYPQYFLCLTWNFLTAASPYRSSFQPVPIYNNNIWDAPAFSRVVATSGTFWQMMQQERPERLATFSSHSISFKTLYEVGYWQKNMVSEDSRIFWNCLLYYDGNYSVVPMSYPVSMDANFAPTFWQTVKNIYKQQRRWCWGTAENATYLLFGFLKNKKINLAKRIKLSLVQIESSWSLATNPLIIFLLGWLPLILGGEEFNATLLSYNLPRITRNLMTLAMFGLVISAIISTWLLPPKPKKYPLIKYLSMIIQWVMVPFTIPVFGAIPGLDAQTRLMLGKYMGFWVTPKHRKSENSKT